MRNFMLHLLGEGELGREQSLSLQISVAAKLHRNIQFARGRGLAGALSWRRQPAKDASNHDPSFARPDSGAVSSAGGWSPAGEHHLGSAAVAAISSIIPGHANALTATVAPGGRSAPAALNSSLRHLPESAMKRISVT